MFFSPLKGTKYYLYHNIVQCMSLTLHFHLQNVNSGYVKCEQIRNFTLSFGIKYPVSWRRQWHPTPVLLPGKSHGWRSLEGCSPWVPEGQTRLGNFPFPFHFHVLEKEMATHSSVLAWRIPGTGEPGGLPSVGSHRAGHD